MADYLSPTVIQPSIPVADITQLEHLVLGTIFDAEPDADALYFYSSDGPNDIISLSATETRAAIDASAGIESTIFAYFAEQLVSSGPDDSEIEIDVTSISWKSIFQDIVRRSPTLPHVTAVTSFTCSKMRPDGFGGAVTLITAGTITGKSTQDVLCQLLDQAEHGPLEAAPGFGVHVLLDLLERQVGEEVIHVIETDPAMTAVAADAVTGADIRAACTQIVDYMDLKAERSTAVFKAALLAISQAEQRLSATTSRASRLGCGSPRRPCP